MREAPLEAPLRGEVSFELGSAPKAESEEEENDISEDRQEEQENICNLTEQAMQYMKQA